MYDEFMPTFGDYSLKVAFHQQTVELIFVISVQ